MTIHVEHQLPKEVAKKRIGELIERYRREYDNELQHLVVEWRDYRAHIRLQARGHNSAGNLEIFENTVELDFHLPFLLKMFGKKIKAVIQDNLQKNLA